MRKAVVLILLFAMPVTIYIIFGSAVHNFVQLPTLTESIQNLDDFEPLNPEEEITYDEFATVLLIYGNDIKNMRGNAYNLHEKIYKPNYIYKDFQIIVVAEKGSEKEAQSLLDELQEFTGVNVLKWKFAFGEAEQIQDLFESMQTNLSLNDKNATEYAFIVDREGNLRGRKKNAKTSDPTLFGYQTRSIANLKDTMVDDVKVLLAEYRFALKKNEKSALKYKEEQ